MRITIKQQVGEIGTREAPETLARLQFEDDEEYPDAKFANDDNINLLNGDTIKLTACYGTDNKHLVIAVLHGIKAIFSARCCWDEVDPVFTIRVKDGCEIRVLCEK